MRSLLLTIILSLIISTNLYADKIFNEIMTAIEQDVTDAQLVALEDKYKGQIISGEGYVDDVRVATFTEGVNIYLMVDKDKYSFTSDVNIEVSENSDYLSIAKKLNKGQKISFSGTFDDIFGGTVYIRGNVKISL